MKNYTIYKEPEKYDYDQFSRENMINRFLHCDDPDVRL